MRAIAANRSPQSHLAGGAAIHRAGIRYSDDLDFFHDDAGSVQAVSERDADDLRRAGFTVTWRKEFPTFRSAVVSDGENATRLDWARDSAFRFFPTEADPEVGYVLHPIDLATNKALAAASRAEPRDTVDLLWIDQHVLPLGAVVLAAVAKDPGFSPEALLNWIVRQGPRRAEEFLTVDTVDPLDPLATARAVKEMTRRAVEYLADMPSEAAGHVFLENGKAVAPDAARLGSYERRSGSPGGIWPGSSEIDSALLRRDV